MMSAAGPRWFVSCVLLVFAWTGAAWAVTAALSGRVIDENGVAIAGARVILNRADLRVAVSATTDEGGRFSLPELGAGTYSLKVEKPGYYAYVAAAFPISEPALPLEVTLNHTQEFQETVSVVYSAPVIDRQEAAAATTLYQEEVVDLPFPSSHDFRNALPLMPGVVKDNLGRVHLNGGAENQAYYTLDGFNMANPVSGILDNRISIDSIRGVRVDSSRYSAEFGKGSAGVMALETSRGDDHFRFLATNFFPSFELHDGLVLSNFNPRATVSGPIVKGRAWFFDALDSQYDMNVVRDLPPGANRNSNWFGSNLARIQVNLTGKNLLTTSFLLNFRDSKHLGITPLDPVETSRNRDEYFYFFMVKDQAYFSGGWILETGFGLNQLNTVDRPLGRTTYTISSCGRSGNYFLESEAKVGRLQGIANVMSPSWNWRGRHSLKFGVDAERIRYRQFADRRPFEVRGLGGQLLRRVGFSGDPRFGRDSSEFSAYVQDRWFPTEQILVEPGIRFDWDQILRRTLVSPRLAATWGPRRLPDSKFSVGVGVFYDAVNLALLTRALDQQRTDTFYADDGVTVRGRPILSKYLANETMLAAPFYLNWSLGWEQKLPKAFYIRANMIQRHGRRGWAYQFLAPAPAASAPESIYQLGSGRNERYSYLEFTLTRTLWKSYNWLMSYARSRARSSAVIDFSLENPIFAQQSRGPLDWDAPNRLISWAALPAPRLKQFTISYFLEWHSGFPYGALNANQELLGAPNSHRFPDYFSVNLHVEWRFRFWRANLALRAGFNNIAGRGNPVVVDNNVDSPTYGHFSGGQGRVFTGRIRFLGKG